MWRFGLLSDVVEWCESEIQLQYELVVNDIYDNIGNGILLITLQGLFPVSYWCYKHGCVYSFDYQEK